MPDGWVHEAHTRGLLTFAEAATLLDMLIPHLLDAMRDGEIEYERIDNKPCVSLTALDAYRRRRSAA
jgi:hypothetical protein